MEFNEKLQLLRKQKGLTQEELAEVLFVSRTAISKWESGRGFPSIDSLKSISQYYSVTLDELVSGDELLVIAEENKKQSESHIVDMVCGLLDCGIALLLFLPFFRQSENGTLQAVSLLGLTGIQSYLRVLYWIITFALPVWGILTLALQDVRNVFWLRSKYFVSLLFSTVGVCLFIISQQPYAAIFAFAFLVIKVLMVQKRQ